MSRVLNVLKNKNKREKINKQRKRQVLASMQLESAYRAKLYDDMEVVRVMLDDNNVESVIIEVPKAYISQFMKAMYGDEMAWCNISQIDANTFEIGRKMVSF